MTLVAPLPGVGRRVGAASAWGAAAGLVAAVAAVAAASSPVLLAVGVGGGAVLVGVWRPAFGVGLVTALAYARVSDIGEQRFGVPGFILPLAVVVAVGALLVAPRPGAARARWAAADRSLGRAALPFGAYGALLLAGVAWSRDPDRVVAAGTEFAKDLVIVAVLLAVVTGGRTLAGAVWGLVVAALALSTLSVVQYATGDFERDFAGFAQHGVQNIVGTRDDVRLAGPVGDPNYYALMLVAVVPLAVELAFRARRRSGRALAALAALACTAAILLTFSRGAVLGLGVVLVGTLWRHRPSPGAVVAVALAGACLLALSPADWLARLEAVPQAVAALTGDEPDDAAIGGRASEFKVGIDMWLDHPLLGVGRGGYPPRYQDYSADLGLDPRREERQPHSLPVEVLAEQGVVGALVFGTLLVGAGRSLVVARRRVAAAGEREVAALLGGLETALLAYLATSLFLHLTFPRVLWILVALAYAAPEVARATLGPPAPPSVGSPGTELEFAL